MNHHEEDEKLRQILKNAHTIATVGLSDSPERVSYHIAAYLKAQGYRVIPVNPTIEHTLGEKAYPDLLSVPGPVDVVQIFRKPEDVPPIVEQAIQKGAKVIWMQEGITNPEAAAQAEAAGLEVVQDHCMRVEHRRLMGVSS
jgi:predicted CoA-binding protein